MERQIKTVCGTLLTVLAEIIDVTAFIGVMGSSFVYLLLEINTALDFSPMTELIITFAAPFASICTGVYMLAQTYKLLKKKEHEAN